MVGIVKWGTAQGGYFGLDTGDYAFQNAEVNLLWQAIGIVVAVGLGVVTAAVLAFILERTTGLRLSEDEQVAGVDGPIWGLEPDVALYASDGQPAPVGATPAQTVTQPGS
jgi:ammonia channel protein AmtB